MGHYSLIIIPHPDPLLLFSYQISINGLFIAIQCFLLFTRTQYKLCILNPSFFNVVFRVMHTTYWHKPDFSVVMCLSRQVSRLRRQSYQGRQVTSWSCEIASLNNRTATLATRGWGAIGTASANSVESDLRWHISRGLTIPHLDLSHFSLCIMGS